MYLILNLKGVELGRHVRFYGKSRTKFATGSSVKIGEKTTFRSSTFSNLIGINRPCILTTHTNRSKLTIGSGCGFSGTVIGCFNSITLGEKVRIGANSLISDSDWHLEDPRAGEPKPIYIGDNVWVGVDCTILKGVNIGNNSIIGAGSIVTSDIPSNVVAAGNPCKVIKKIS